MEQPVPYQVAYTPFTMPPGGHNPPKVTDFTALRLMFLDLDEVLTSNRTMVAFNRIPHPGHGKDPETGKRIIQVISPESFDPVGIALINKLCEATNTFIVLSSSWRIGFTAEEARDMLEMIGIKKEYILGKTHSYGKVRGQQISDFIRAIQGTSDAVQNLVDTHLLLPEFASVRNVKVLAYAIIDDSSDMLEEQRDHFVHVNAVEGFSLSDAIYTGRILSMNPEFGLRNLTLARPGMSSLN